MPDPRPPEKALTRWEDEGGAEPDGPLLVTPEGSPAPMAAPSPTEWAEMHTRVIALESLVIALLSTASEAQRMAAREMAGLITPRPGATPHRLTVHAAHRMIDLIDRAERHDVGRG